MKNIGIISLGLIGGSILKGLNKTNKYNLLAFSSNEKTKQELKNYKNVIVISSLEELKQCSLVFICSPISKTVEQIQKISSFVNNDCIICDVASLKNNIMQQCQNLPCKFISTHPMAGTEKTGFENSFEEMFNNAKWVIIQNNNQQENDINFVKEIICDLGAYPIITDEILHDKACALISHTPALISQALVCTLLNEDDEKIKELAKTLASSGFRDTTRLAMSNKDMIRDMLDFNNENIKEALNAFIQNAQKLLNDKNFYEKTIEEIINLRKNMY